MKNYYRILGVLDDAEDIIIRAAYKALAQRYHPDKWRGDSTEANQRMSDINEAYGILSDDEKRKIYDNEYYKNKPRDEKEKEEEFEGDFNEFQDEDVESWIIACEFFPSIEYDYLDLKKYDLVLANTFRTEILVNQDFKNSYYLRSNYENEYLSRYYGRNKELQDLAKYLIHANHKKAALRLNKLIKTIGETIDANRIKNKILREFKETKEYDLVEFKEIIIKKLFENDGAQLLNNEAEFLFNKVNNYEYRLNYNEKNKLFVYLKGSEKIELNRKDMIKYLMSNYIMEYKAFQHAENRKTQQAEEAKVKKQKKSEPILKKEPTKTIFDNEKFKTDSAKLQENIIPQYQYKENINVDKIIERKDLEVKKSKADWLKPPILAGLIIFAIYSVNKYNTFNNESADKEIVIENIENIEKIEKIEKIIDEEKVAKVIEIMECRLCVDKDCTKDNPFKNLKVDAQNRISIEFNNDKPSVETFNGECILLDNKRAECKASIDYEYIISEVTLKLELPKLTYSLKNINKETLNVVNGIYACNTI